MSDFLLFGGDMAEAELTGLAGGACAIGRGGRPRQGGNSVVSSSAVIAGLSL